MTELVKYDAACKALAAAVRVDDVKKIRDEAEAVRAYARQVKNRDLEVQAAEIRLRAERRLGELIVKQKEKFGLHRGGRPSAKTRSAKEQVFEPVKLAEVGIDRKLSMRAQHLAAVSTKDFERMLGEFRERVSQEGERVTVSLIAAGARAQKRKAKYAGMSDPGPLPDEQFDVLYFDPPTKYESGDSDRSADNHYPTMSFDELAALPLGTLGKKKSVLYCWSTVPWLEQTMQLLKLWGYEYKSAAFWDKELFGTGHWFRNQNEVLLVASRGGFGSPDKKKIRIASSHYAERRTDHSAKPVYFRELIERYHPDARKVEIFARGGAAEGWTAWGNEVEDPKTAVTDEKEREALAAIADGGNLIGLAGRRLLLQSLRDRKFITGKAKPKLTGAGRARLADLAEEIARQKALAELPDSLEELTEAYGRTIRQHHEFVLAADAAGVKTAEALLDLLQIRANGGTHFGMLTDNGKPEKMRAANDAPQGVEPMWAQRGLFQIDVDGMAVLVEYDGQGDFGFYAVDRTKPFISETGFRSCLGPDVPALGFTVAQQAESYVREEMRGEDVGASGKRRPRKAPMPLPQVSYRMPKRGLEVVRAGGKLTRMMAAPAAHAPRKRGTKRRAKAKVRRGRRRAPVRKVKARTIVRKKKRARA